LLQAKEREHFVHLVTFPIVCPIALEELVISMHSAIVVSCHESTIQRS
jgi:hypothetical protein